MMYGKHFASMYKGSMYGAGPVFFAVMGYIIANTNKSRIELNPRELANILGATKEEVQKVIDQMTSPDPESRNKEHDGRKLIREGEFQYFVTGWAKYQSIRNEDARRESNKQSQRRSRARKNGTPEPEIEIIPPPVINDKCAAGGVVQAMDTLIKNEEQAKREQKPDEPQVNF